MTDIVLDESRGNLAVITINRPHRRNALDGDAWRHLGDAFDTVAARPALRGVILTGAGGHFCAGDDILAFSKVRDDASLRARYWSVNRQSQHCEDARAFRT